MATQCQWVILAAVVTLASSDSATPTASPELFLQLQQTVKCCDFNKVLPSSFTTETRSTITNSNGELEEESGKNFITCEAIKSVLNEYNLLNQDKSIKEQEIRNLFTGEGDIKDIQKESLDNCFEEHKNTPVVHMEGDKENTCKSQAMEIIGCVIQGILFKCPASAWKAAEPGCNRPVKQD